MVLIDRLKADKLIKTTNSIELFHTFTTLQAKKSALTLLHRYLYSLYECPLVDETENSKKSEKFNLSIPKKTFYSSKQGQDVVAVVRGLDNQV